MATKKKTVANKKTAVKKKAASRSKPGTKKKAAVKWSKQVNESSDALDLEKDVFKSASATKIADSLKRSAMKSNRRKARPFQSAMSMLNFYINRGGKNLSASRKKVLEKAKDKLREAFNRDTE
jgi:hypothetical protein